MCGEQWTERGRGDHGTLRVVPLHCGQGMRPVARHSSHLPLDQHSPHSRRSGRARVHAVLTVDLVLAIALARGTRHRSHPLQGSGKLGKMTIRLASRIYSRGAQRSTSPSPYQYSGRTSHTSRVQQAPESEHRSPREPARMWLGGLRSKGGGHHAQPLTSRRPYSCRHLSQRADGDGGVIRSRAYRRYPKAEALEGGRRYGSSAGRGWGRGGCGRATRQPIK